MKRKALIIAFGLIFLFSSAAYAGDALDFAWCMVNAGIGVTPIGTLYCVVNSSSESEIVWCLLGEVPYIGEAQLLLEVSECLGDTAYIPGSCCDTYYTLLCHNYRSNGYIVPPWYCNLCLSSTCGGSSGGGGGGGGPLALKM